MADERRRRIVEDEELLELFGSDPESLAVVDAIAATQSGHRLVEDASESRNRRRRLLSRSRVTQRPTRRVGAIVGGLAVLIAAAPAFSIVRNAIDFNGSTKAPAVILRDFATLSTIDRLNGLGELTGSARLVYTFETSRRRHTLYAAPTRDGFCWGVSGMGATCVGRNSPPVEPFTIGPPPAGSNQEALVAAAVSARAQHVAVTFEDGSSVNIEIVNVSPPIGAGFVLYEVPQKQLMAGKTPAYLSAYDASGHLIGRGRLMFETH